MNPDLPKSENPLQDSTTNKNSSETPLNFSQPTQQPNTTPDSKTNVNFSDYIKSEWKSEKREVISFRGNSELYNEFKKVSKALYGSTCRAFEFYMASVVLATRQKVNFCHTQQPIQIGKIVIERNLRPRRVFEYAGEIEQTETVTKTETKKRLVVGDVPDYSGYPLEKLDRLHRRYRNSGQMGKSALVCAELKRRGVFNANKTY